MKTEIIEKANYWINQQDFEEEMIVLTEGIEEYNHCSHYCGVKKRNTSGLEAKNKLDWRGYSNRLLN